jgi:lipopolysaccharide transport system ATP-binding protein
MSSPIITTEDLGKRYRVGTWSGGYGRLTESLSNAVRKPFRKGGNGSTEDQFVWALRDLSIEIDEGDVLGVVGRNGAGKTTLLKLLSRITEPTAGQADLYGRVGSLLEVGTGFHPELTGRENIYLNGAILGMRRTETDAKFDDIVEFAEVERFIDTPVKRYSTGMTVRLAFAVAAHLEPEILIVDEVLAVGDAAFQKKCIGKMSEVAHEGRTVLFVSHNMGAVSELCTRALLLDQGQLVTQGTVPDVLEAYGRLITSDEHQIELNADPTLPCSILGVRLEDGDGNQTTSFDLQDTIRIRIVYEVTSRIHGLQVTATLARNVVDIVHSFDTDALDEIPPTEPGRYEAAYTIPPMFLKAGNYATRVTTGTPERLLQDLMGVLSFEIEERSINTHMKGYRRDRQGHVISPGSWETRRLGD